MPESEPSFADFEQTVTQTSQPFSVLAPPTFPGLGGQRDAAGASSPNAGMPQPAAMPQGAGSSAPRSEAASVPPAPINPLFGEDPSTQEVRDSVYGAEPIPAVAPPAAGAGAGSSGAGAGGAGSPKPGDRKRRLMIALLATLIAAVVAVALVLVGVLTYRAGVWGNKTVPQIAVNGAAVSTDTTGKDGGTTATAAQVSDALKGQGFNTTIVQAYAAAKKGDYAGMTDQDGRALNTGDKVRSNATINVVESLGPGVPKGTVGKPAAEAQDAVDTMGVDVHAKSVLVSQDSDVQEGTVVRSYPADGQPVEDTKQGIYLGVATKKGDGIPTDILGKDKETVKKDLEANGHHVTLKPRFSSKQYVGKVSGSNPTPGSELGSGDDVTVYYGIDASQTWDVFTETNTSWPWPVQRDPGSFVAGHYCTNAGKCISLNLTVNSRYTNGPQSEMITVDNQAEGDDGHFRRLVSCLGWQQACSSPAETAKGHFVDPLVLYKRWGMFEMFPFESIMTYYCGDTKAAAGPPGSTCVNGQLKSWDELGDNYSSIKPSGAEWRMDDYYVYFPVGSDLQKLEDSGYFDKDSLAAAKKQKAVDANRPFIVVRDKSQYERTTLEYGSNYNPFVPQSGALGDKTKMLPMKPAPSDETVYYLQEDAVDWTKLPDATVATAGKDGKSDADQPQAKKTYTNDEIKSSLTDGDFTPIAGKYCRKSNTSCVSLAKDGTLSLVSGDKPVSYVKDVKLHYDPTYWGDYGSKIFSLNGPDSDMYCTINGQKYTGKENCEKAPSAMTKFPVNPMYIPKGTTLAASTNAKFPFTTTKTVDTSKPFLLFMYFHMNPDPADETTYYLQDE